MWFRKKAPAKARDFQECTGCGCLMRFARATVDVGYISFTAVTEYYCGKCAPPYTKRRYDGVGWRYPRKEPARNVEVDEKGKVIKEKSAPH